MSADQPTKRCTRCKVDKPIGEFTVRRRSKDGREYYCKMCKKVDAQSDYVAHRDRYLARAKKWSDDNAHRREQIAKQWARENKQLTQQRDAARYLANPEKYSRKAAAWKLANPAKARAANSKRRALSRTATIGDAKQIKAFYEVVATAERITCHWCGKPVRKSERCVDHIIPLARGGQHVVFNLCCSCARCNNRKHTKLPAEFTGQHELVFT
jgi:5-methylcytosine-specific restriction endonuclease McrA